MRSVADIAADAQIALWADPFSVWVYEIHDGVEVWRPAGFTPAEWEAHQRAALLGEPAESAGVTFISSYVESIMSLFIGFDAAMKGFADSMQSFADAMQPFAALLPAALLDEEADQ